MTQLPKEAAGSHHAGDTDPGAAAPVPVSVLLDRLREAAAAHDGEPPAPVVPPSAQARD